MDNKIEPSVSNIVLEDIAAKYHDQLTDEAITYLNERGVNKESIEKFLVGYEKETIGFQPEFRDFTGYFHNRIIFPLLSVENIIVDLVGRSLDEKEPKYKSLVGVENVFFNERVLTTSEDIILTNSIFDVISLDQAKLPSICLIHNQITEDQIHKLSGKRVFICLGNDEIGRRESNRITKAIHEKVKELYFINLPKGVRDVNDFFTRVKDPIEEFVLLINETLKNSINTPISPDSKYLTNFQEEYIKRSKGNLLGIKTGFHQLDNLLIGGLQEGLHLIGGDVSAGKTTFLKQLADQIASHVPVIFITWEMTSFELWVRSMSRLIGISSQEILAGKVAFEKIQEANKAYALIAKNIWTIDADINYLLEDFATHLNKIQQNLNKKPLIILDSLQRINMKNTSGKNSSEIKLQIVYNLHNWSRQWGIPILLTINGKKNEISSDLLAAVDVYFHLERNQAKLALDIVKNRNGNLGEIRFDFNSNIGNLSENF